MKKKIILFLLAYAFMFAAALFFGELLDEGYYSYYIYDSEDSRESPAVLQIQPITYVIDQMYVPIYASNYAPNNELFSDSIAMFPSIFITSPYSPFEDRELWQDATISFTSPHGGFSFEKAEARVRGRGNSTWRDGPNKRPLRFTLAEALPLLPGSEARNWILLADYFDMSLLRNYSALYFGALLGRMSFVPSMQHLHLYVNGDYMGVYLLTDERDVGPGRLDIAWHQDPAKSGFFIELDARAPDGGIENESFVMVNAMAYDIRYPGSSGRTPEHMQYVREYLEAVSFAIRYQSFDEVLALIDLDTFVDFYLVQELFKNMDVHSLSVFMYIDGVGDERRLYKGPIWDFDIAAGNHVSQPLGYRPEFLYAAVVNYWYRHLMKRPEFRDAVVLRWNEIVDLEVAQTISTIVELATRHKEDFERNFERHPNMGAASTSRPPELLEIPGHMGQTLQLADWLKQRSAWLHEYFNYGIPGYDPMWALVEYYMFERPIHINVNGTYRHFDVSPIILRGRVMPPLHELAEIFEISVNDDFRNGWLVLEGEGTSVIHRVGSSIFTINGVNRDFGAASLAILDYVFVPINAIAAAFGLELEWNHSAHTVIITEQA